MTASVRLISGRSRSPQPRVTPQESRRQGRAGDSGAGAEPVVDEARAERVATAVAAWRERLTLLAGGSALWDVESLGEACVDLTAAHPGGVASLLAGRSTTLSNLVREPAALAGARRRTRLVLARSDDLAQRHGVAATTFAFGVATWPELPKPSEGLDGDHSDAAAEASERAEPRLVRAPVLLRPVRFGPAQVEGEHMLTLEPPVEVNPVLMRALSDAGAGDRAAEIVRSRLSGAPADLHGALESLGVLVRDALGPSAHVEERLLVGCFVHPGQWLADDLDADVWAGHDVVAALAGDESARSRLMAALPERVEQDRAPGLERGVGDLDPAQQHVIDALMTGAHLFVDAPPGADVVGVVTAILAEAAASGKHAVHVPGTRRAGAAVVEAMRAAGVAELMLDLDPETDWRSRVVDRFADRIVADVPEVDEKSLSAMRAELVRTRGLLVSHVAGLHERREPWGISAHDALQHLAELTAQRPGPSTEVRLDAATVRALDPAAREEAREQLVRAGAVGALRMRRSSSAWHGVRVSDAAQAREVVANVQLLAARVLPQLRRAIAEATAHVGLEPPETLARWHDQIVMLSGVRASLDVFDPAIFERSAADLVAATSPRSWRGQGADTMGWRARSRLRRQAKDLVRPGRHVADLHGALVRVQEQRDAWRRQTHAGGWPSVPEDMIALEALTAQAEAAISALESPLAGTLRRIGSGGAVRLAELRIGDLEDHLLVLAADEDAVASLPERASVLSILEARGLGALVDDLAERRVPMVLAGAELELAWWSSALEEIIRSDGAMSNAHGVQLTPLAERLRELDREQVDSLSPLVLRASVRHSREVMKRHREAARNLFGLVRTAVQGARGAAAAFDLREVMEAYPQVAPVIVPCWSVPPMLVPQVLPRRVSADLVVLDAVQHLPVEQAVGALARGAQVVIVGDSRRVSGGVVDELATLLPRVTLPADRSDRDERLTAFLAEHGYHDALAPIPAPPGRSRIALHVVDGRGLPAVDRAVVESVPTEVEHVVGLVIEHALTRPQESLAVIALNARHADRVREAVTLAVADSPAVARFFDPSRSEPFTVVDVESASGLRRDAVVMSVGFAKTYHGRVLHQFGAISTELGAALLVDALDSCRHALTVVSCVGPAEIDRTRLRSAGSLFLHDILDFAERGGAPREVEEREGAPDPLLVDLAERLWRMGLVVSPRYGRPTGVRIPLAVGHPEIPGELVVALLVDDDAYVNEPSLRARDRHWIERLERRGWVVRMLSSTQIFMDPDGQAEAVRDLVIAVARERRLDIAGFGPRESPQVPEVLVEAVDAEEVDAEPSLDPAVAAAVPAEAPAAPSAEMLPAGNVGLAAPEPAALFEIAPAAEAASGPQPRSERQGPRPDVRPGLPMAVYTDDQVDAIAAWLASDGVARTLEELEDEVKRDLGLTRRSRRSESMVRAASERALGLEPSGDA